MFTFLTILLKLLNQHWTHRKAEADGNAFFLLLLQVLDHKMNDWRNWKFDPMMGLHIKQMQENYRSYNSSWGGHECLHQISYQSIQLTFQPKSQMSTQDVTRGITKSSSQKDLMNVCNNNLITTHPIIVVIFQAINYWNYESIIKIVAEQFSGHWSILLITHTNYTHSRWRCSTDDGAELPNRTKCIRFEGLRGMSDLR